MIASAATCKTCIRVGPDRRGLQTLAGAHLDEEIEYDVWLEESWAFAESQEEDCCDDA